MIFEFLFWIAILAFLYSYFLFPFILKLLAIKKYQNTEVYSFNSDLPFVSVIMAVHNEEQVLAEKIKSIFYTSYPIDKFEVIVGSDSSTDGTNRILNVFSKNYIRFYVRNFNRRTGKPEIINNLIQQAKGEIILFTDANVFFYESTLFEIVKHFKNPEIGLVDTKVIHRDITNCGISLQENSSLKQELLIKEMESIIWGKMIGPFGGCYAIRKSIFVPVPANFIRDDFFFNMYVLSINYKTITASSALVNEDVPLDIIEEFRRKVRIAGGNFQNLGKFFRMLWPPFRPVGFCFLSHKVLRWLGPFFILLAFFSNIFLLKNELYKYLLITQIALALLALTDFIISKLNANVVFLRFISYFFIMNFATLKGFIKYLSGINSNIWQPAPRNQRCKKFEDDERIGLRTEEDFF